MSFYHSYLIPALYHHSFIIPSSFHHLNVIPSFECHSIIWMSFHNSSVIPSIIVHVGNILSFGCHFIHLVVIRALEWRGMTFCRNDRNEVRMTVSVILRAFLSFLSSQISGKNVVFLDFIPIIPAHSCHSGVIRKFWFNVNCHGMMSNEGMKATTFPLCREWIQKSCP